MKPDITTRDTKTFLLVLGTVLAYFSIKQYLGGNLGFYYLFLLCSFLFISIGVTRPQILRPLHLVFVAVFKFIITVLTSIVLIIVFYLVVSPLRLLLAFLGKDLLNLKHRTKDSYWIKRVSFTKKEDYLRQF